MGNELITRDQLQSDLETLYNNKISPYLNGSAHAGFTPVGSLLFYDGLTPPDNYLVCDGTVYNIADYPELANHYETQYGSKNAFGGDGVTTFAVRDLQGEFIRCAGTNSHAGQGSGGDVGEHQDATKHIGSAVDFDQWIMAGASSTSARVEDFDYMAGPGYRTWTPKHSASSSGDFDCGEYTSRPTNTSMLICVAYKNIYIDAVIGNTTTEITNPQDGQGLVYDATNDVWKNGAGGMHEYSTAEKVVGTWIDGRPVYEKTIVYGPFVCNATTKTFSIGINNNNDFDFMIGFEGATIRSQQNSNNIWVCGLTECQTTAQLVNIYYNAYNDGLSFHSTAASGYDDVVLRVTVKWVKTTDTPTVQS